jgi:hypothetical protein
MLPRRLISWSSCRPAPFRLGDLERDLDEKELLERLRYRPTPLREAGPADDLEGEWDPGRYTSDLGPYRLPGDMRRRPLPLPVPLFAPIPAPGGPPRPPEKGTLGSMLAPRRAVGGAGESLRRGSTMETLMAEPSTCASCI